MAKNIIEKMAESQEQIEAFKQRQKLPYEAKVDYARAIARNFKRDIEDISIGGNVHISVGGLDSITLLKFLRDECYINCPAISVSSLEDKSIQAVHKEMGVETVKPIKSKVEVIREFGWPVLSKEIAGKISLLQNPSDKNVTVRHAIITGETGEYGGNRTGSRMKLSQRWLERFGGADAEGAEKGYCAAPFLVSDKCCYYLKEKPCDDWAKEHNSYPYLGLMASEGGRRQKALMINGCNYISETTKRSAPFAIFSRQDLLQLALDLNVHVPKVYGEIKRTPQGILYTTGAQRTGCSMCGFGIHMEKRPHRFDLLRESNPVEWEFWMKRVCQDKDGNWYGFGRVLDYIGVGWEDDPAGNISGQLDFWGGIV